VLFDVGENTPQPSVIQPMPRLYRRPDELMLTRMGASSAGAVALSQPAP
jgi:hypothetical protein